MSSLGVTRSCRKMSHLLQTPDTFVRAPLPGMVKATAIVHSAPAIGAKFFQYTAELEAGGGIPPSASQRFVYVVSGRIRVDSELNAGSFGYCPPNSLHEIHAAEDSRIVVIEKPYQKLASCSMPEAFTGSISKIAANPLMGDTAVRVQSLFPDSPQFDFAVNLMTFDPGAELSMVEIHVMEHGLLFLNGGGIYRLGDCWHPVSAGDFIWMAPYCPQWFGAIGKQPAQYLIYKDWNRHPQG